nr:hypothetical protein GCM10020185_56810 [Pseudomonas brassicacearum subsp. brassicacearum]
MATKVFLHQGFTAVLRANPREAVDLGVAQHLGVGDGQVDTGAEFLDSVRQAGNAALALGPVTGRQVEQHLGQAIGVEQGLEFGGAVVIGEQVFDATEPSLGGGFETGEEILLGEQHGQVGGETRHGGLL